MWIPTRITRPSIGNTRKYAARSNMASSNPRGKARNIVDPTLAKQMELIKSILSSLNQYIEAIAKISKRVDIHETGQVAIEAIAKISKKVDIHEAGQTAIEAAIA